MSSMKLMPIVFIVYLSLVFGDDQTSDELENCTAPVIENVPLEQILDKTFYIVWQTYHVGGTCQNITVSASDTSATTGTMTVNTLNGSSTSPWLSYHSGIMVYKLENNATQPNNYFTFIFYNNNENSPQSFGALVCLNNTYYEEHNNVTHRMPQKQQKNLIVATTESNPSQDYLDELKSQTIKTDPGLSIYNLVSIDQAGCNDDQSSNFA